MQTKLNPYISFKDNAREAIQFYHSVFGGKLTLNTFKEFHASHDPAEDNLIMHAELETKNGMTLMASDTPTVWNIALERTSACRSVAITRRN